MDNIREASNFLTEFLSGFFSGEYTAGDSNYFMHDAFIYDSTRTTDSFEKTGKSTVDITDMQKKCIAPSVYEFSLLTAITKTFSETNSCSVSARITAVVVYTNETFKISSFHASIPSELLDYLDFLPVTEDFLNLSQIKAEFDNRTARIEQQQKTDTLTGILQGNSAKKLIDSYLQNSPENAVLMLFDLNNFKQINESYGHKTGDEVLIQFTEILKESFRASDVIARLGGDEFIVFMKYANIETIEKRAGRICSQIQELSDKYGSILSASIGISLPEKDDTYHFEQLYFRADKALSGAKQKGKNNYHIYA